MNVKGASLVVWVNENGEIIEAKEAHKDNGTPISDVKYDPGEKRRMVKGERSTRLMYTNPCCWRWTPSGWVCGPCT